MTRRVVVDYERLFESVPTPQLVLSPDLLIVAANPAYLEATGRRREDLIGKDPFDAFPDNPEDAAADGVRQMRASLERVRDTGEPETMPIQRYDIPASDGEGFLERYWSPVNVPVFDAEGRVALLLNRAEDVTDFVRAERGPLRDTGRPAPREERVRSEVFARSRELAGLNLELRETAERERLAAERLAGLTQAALTMAGTQRIEELSEAVVESGLKAMGADAGAVAVRDSEQAVIRLTVTDSLGPETQRQYGELPLDGPLPASVAANTGELVLLEDLAAGLAWSPQMARCTPRRARWPGPRSRCAPADACSGH